MSESLSLHQPVFQMCHHIEVQPLWEEGQAQVVVIPMTNCHYAQAEDEEMNQEMKLALLVLKSE